MCNPYTYMCVCTCERACVRSCERARIRVYVGTRGKSEQACTTGVSLSDKTCMSFFTLVVPKS